MVNVLSGRGLGEGEGGGFGLAPALLIDWLGRANRHRMGSKVKFIVHQLNKDC
jgi:hypothetical protein